MKFTVFLLALSLIAPPLEAMSRLKELVSIDGVRDNQLVGYGLVVGLNGAGDGTEENATGVEIAEAAEDTMTHLRAAC